MGRHSLSETPFLALCECITFFILAGVSVVSLFLQCNGDAGYFTRADWSTCSQNHDQQAFAVSQ